MTVLATRRCVFVALITVIWMFWLALFPAMLCPALYAQQIDPEHGAKGFFVAGMDQKIGGADP